MWSSVIFVLVLLFSQADEHLQQARALFEQRRFAEAWVEARKALHFERENLDAWKLSGLSLQLAKRLPEAEQEFLEALKHFSPDPDLWFYLSRVQYLQHKLRAADQTARQAVTLNPRHADAFTQLAMILEAKQDHESALANYRLAIRLNQESLRAETMPLVNAGLLLQKLGRLQESLEYLTTAAEINPSSDQIRSYRQRVLERLARGNHQDTKHTKKNSPVRFRNVASSAKLNFTLRNSATPNKYQVETMLGGVAVLDYDNDGDQDIYFTNGAALPSLEKNSPEYWNRLYRNNGNATFTDVTARAGVRGEGYSMGVAIADYDNDGDSDIFVAGVNRNILFRNNGDGAFQDVTTEAKLNGIDPHRGKMWSVAAVWFDYDHDGRLDLFVVNYCKWNTSLDPYCGLPIAGYRSYCFPDRYEGLPNQLFRNHGDGTFSDVSVSSGIASHIGKGMGVAVADFDEDGLADVFVANDTVPNFLFQNQGDGKFEEVALRAGVAVTENGTAVSSMGVDFRDYDNDGHSDLLVSALEGETFPLFRNLGKGFFSDETYPSGIGLASAKRSGWSLGLFDFNNDGYKDLFTVNAHVNDNIELYNEQTYRQSNSIFVNQSDGRFRERSKWAGSDFQHKAAHRGAAFGDFNNDGKMDVVTTSINEPAELFLNDLPERNHWLLVDLQGTRSNRDGIGARVKLVTASGVQQYNHVTTSVGYASSSDRRVHFGLGKETVVKTLEIRWPSGKVQVLNEVRADQILTILEP